MLKTMSTLFLFVIVLLCYSCDLEVVEDNLIIENENRTFEKLLGGPAINEGYDIIETQSGGYAIAGVTTSYGAGGYDFYFLILDKNGEVIVEKTFGGSLDDIAYSLTQTADGGFAIVGSTNSFGAGDNDVYLILTDENGNELPSSGKTFGGFYDEGAKSIITTAEGGLAITGFTESMGSSATTADVYLILTDKNGNELANSGKTYGGIDVDYGNSIIQKQDGGFAIFGTTANNGNVPRDFYLVLTDAEGNELPTSGKSYINSGLSYGNGIVETSNGFAMIGNSKLSNSDKSNIHLILTDKNGDEFSSSGKIFGDTIDHETGQDLIQLADGGLAITGSTKSLGKGGTDTYLIHTDENGNLISEKTFGSIYGDAGLSIIQTTEGNLGITGYTKSLDGPGTTSIYFIKTDADGNL